MKNQCFKFLQTGVSFLVIIFFASCSTQKGWVYKSNYWGSVEKDDKKILIPTFIDDRGAENKDALLMSWVPICPFGWQNLSTPELVPRHLTSSLWLNFDPKIDFAKALTQEIIAGTSFKEAIYTEYPVNTGYYIQGRIINTDYKAKMYSYGCSLWYSILWLIGLPAGSFSNDLELELTCYAPGNKIIFQKVYKADTYKKTTWTYALKNDFEYPILLKKLYAEFIRDFNQQLVNN